MEEEVKRIINETFAIEMDQIKDDSVLKDDLGIDSLDATSLIIDMEEKYNIEVTNEELASLVRVKDVIKLLEAKGVKAE